MIVVMKIDELRYDFISLIICCISYSYKLILIFWILKKFNLFIFRKSNFINLNFFKRIFLLIYKLKIFNRINKIFLELKII